MKQSSCLKAVKTQQLIENENGENVPHLGSTEVVFTARKVSKYGICSGPYFPVFGPLKIKNKSYSSDVFLMLLFLWIYFCLKLDNFGILLKDFGMVS